MAIKPEIGEQLLAAQRHLHAGQFDRLAGDVEWLLAMVPDDAQVMYLAGRLALARRQMDAAVDCFRAALQSGGADVETLVWFGIALFEDRKLSEAVRALQRACELAPQSALAWSNLGRVLARVGRGDAAITALTRAAELAPDELQTQLALAEVDAGLGNVEPAVDRLRRVRDQPEYWGYEAWAALSAIKAQPFASDELRDLEQTHQRAVSRADVHAQIALGFALARAREDAGRFDAAFAVLQQANALQRSQLAWNRDAAHDHVRRIGSAFRDSPAAAVAPQTGVASHVFIASLPRSGSTLAERVLAAHPQVATTGELDVFERSLGAESRRRRQHFPLWVGAATADDWHRLGADYDTRTGIVRNAAPCLVDKSLSNWIFAGAILRAFPDAKVILVERDPVETCLACYRQWLVSKPFTFDLDDMAARLEDYRELTAVWAQNFPRRAYRLDYEALAGDFERSVRALLEFVGLDFDARCLTFQSACRTLVGSPSAVQVLQPVHPAIARAPLYGYHLDRLRARFAAGAGG